MVGRGRGVGWVVAVGSAAADEGVGACVGIPTDAMTGDGAEDGPTRIGWQPVPMRAATAIAASERVM